MVVVRMVVMMRIMHVTVMVVVVMAMVMMTMDKMIPLIVDYVSLGFKIGSCSIVTMPCFL